MHRRPHARRRNWKAALSRFLRRQRQSAEYRTLRYEVQSGGLFTSTVFIENQEIARGSARSKQRAEHAAAKEALQVLRQEEQQYYAQRAYERALACQRSNAVVARRVVVITGADDPAEVRKKILAVCEEMRRELVQRNERRPNATHSRPTHPVHGR